MIYCCFDVGGRTLFVGLEHEFWECLEDIAYYRKLTLQELVADVCGNIFEDCSSILRVYAFKTIVAYATASDLTHRTRICEPSSQYH